MLLSRLARTSPPTPLGMACFPCIEIESSPTVASLLQTHALSTRWLPPDDGRRTRRDPAGHSRRRLDFTSSRDGSIRPGARGRTHGPRRCEVNEPCVECVETDTNEESPSCTDPFTPIALLCYRLSCHTNTPYSAAALLERAVRRRRSLSSNLLKSVSPACMRSTALQQGFWPPFPSLSDRGSS